MQKRAAVKTLELRLIHEQNDDGQVDDDGQPRGFATAGAREVVLQMEQERGDSVFVEVTVGSFPVPCVIEFGSLRRSREALWV